MRTHQTLLGFLLLLAGTLLTAQPLAASPAPSGWLTRPDFWVATAANVAGIGLFVARVHAPAIAPVMGAATELIGIPALIVGVVDLATRSADATTAGMFCYAAWAVGAAFVDHVLKLDYRHPAKPAVLVPYVVAYYAAIGLASATQLVNGLPPWLIAGSTCLLAVAASFYARAKGAD